MRALVKGIILDSVLEYNLEDVTTFRQVLTDRMQELELHMQQFRSDHCIDNDKVERSVEHLIRATIKDESPTTCLLLEFTFSWDTWETEVDVTFGLIVQVMVNQVDELDEKFRGLLAANHDGMTCCQ